eukprot:6703465-Prymnesium_polylepis.1
MAQGCAAALVRSGERGRHALYLQSAVQRLERTQKLRVFILQTLTWGSSTSCMKNRGRSRRPRKPAGAALSRPC